MSPNILSPSTIQVTLKAEVTNKIQLGSKEAVRTTEVSLIPSNSFNGVHL
jgi:hypothetical protein